MSGRPDDALSAGCNHLIRSGARPVCGAEDILQYFTITSDYEIHLMDYSKDAHKTRTEEVFTLDAQRNFLLQKSEELN